MKGGKYSHLFLMLATLIFMLAVAEALLHVHIRISKGYWLFVGNKNFQVGFTVPVSDERVFALRPGFVGWGITIDSLGIRANKLSKKSQSRKIANMGDSVPFGIKVRDKETYPYFLDSMMKAHDYSWDVINGGIPGYNMWQAYYNLKNLVYPEYRPEIVTFQAANDLFLLSYYRENWTPKVNWSETKFSRTWGETSKSSLVYYLRNILIKKPEPENYLKHSGKAMLDYMQEQLVPEMIGFCRKNNMTLIFLPVDPFYYSNRNAPQNSSLDLWNENINDVDIWDETVKSYNAILSDYAVKNEHVYFFDVRAYLDGYDRNHLFVDYIHYSPEGGRLVGVGLYHFITENGILN